MNLASSPQYSHSPSTLFFLYLLFQGKMRRRQQHKHFQHFPPWCTSLADKRIQGGRRMAGRRLWLKWTRRKLLTQMGGKCCLLCWKWSGFVKMSEPREATLVTCCQLEERENDFQRWAWVGPFNRTYWVPDLHLDQDGVKMLLVFCNGMFQCNVIGALTELSTGCYRSEEDDPPTWWW